MRPSLRRFGASASSRALSPAYLRQLPAPLTGINLQYGLTLHRPEQVKPLEIEDCRVELRAVTGRGQSSRPVCFSGATYQMALMRCAGPTVRVDSEQLGW